MAELPSGTVTFLFTDIEGSTRLLKELGDRYGEVLEAHRRILRKAVEAHDGREVDTQGDSFFFAFARANAGLAAAVVAQRALAEHDWPEGAEVRVRMGLHTGEPAVGDEQYVGLGVHRAARIGAAAHGGQVLLSSATRELVEDEVGGVSVRELGLYRLKDIDRPEQLYQLDIEGLQTDFPPLKAEKVAEQRPLRGRAILLSALAAALAAAVAVPLFALSGGSGSSHAAAPLGANAVTAVDAATSTIAGSANLEAAPDAIAYGAGSVWVTMPNQDAVSRIDPRTSIVQQTTSVGHSPVAVAVGGGFVWVANSLDGTVSQIDPQTNGGQVVSTIPVGNGPSGVAYGMGGVWVANSVDRSVRRIDPHTGAPGKPITVDVGADALAVGDGAVWVTAKAAGVLSRVDPRSGSLTPINVGNGPVAVAAVPGAVWVVNSGDASVWRIDPATNRVVATVGVGDGPSDVAAAPDGRSVWVSNGLSGTLSKIDPKVNRPVKSVTVGDRPQGVALGSTTTYVAVQAARSHRGGTLTIAVAGSLSDTYGARVSSMLDPSSGYGDWGLLSLTNDGLVGYPRTGGAEGLHVVPDLAVAAPIVGDGGRTYTFQLRPGIRYSTGAPVRPADIRRGIERALLNNGTSVPNSYLGGIVGAGACLKASKRCDLSKGIVTEPGSNIVTFHLTEPDPDFLFKLALPIAAAVPAGTPLAARLPLPATGPYEIASYDDRRGVVRLVRNPRFRVWAPASRPNGFPDRIVERFGFTPVSALTAVERGSADITAESFKELPPEVRSSLDRLYSSHVHSAPSLGTTAFWLNTRLPPFDDIRVRRALNYAIDRNRLVAFAGGRDVSQITCQVLPPNIDGYRRYCPYTRSPNAAGTYSGPDMAKAVRLVAASGTKGQSVTVWVPDIPIGRLNGAYLASVLQRLGYEARYKTVPPGPPFWKPNRQVGVTGWSVDYPSTNNVFEPVFTCRAYTPNPNTNENFAGFCDPHLDAAIARAHDLQTTDPATATRLWRAIDREITDQAPWIPIRTDLVPDIVSRGTGNYVPCFLAGATGACLDQLWVR